MLDASEQLVMCWLQKQSRGNTYVLQVFATQAQAVAGHTLACQTEYIVTAEPQ